MKAQIEDFETGWFGIKMGIKNSEIDAIIESLQNLKQNANSHFHFRSEYSGKGGIGDIEIYIEEESVNDNLMLDPSYPIEPNK
jgi:hypothetical protein